MAVGEDDVLQADLIGSHESLVCVILHGLHLLPIAPTFSSVRPMEVHLNGSREVPVSGPIARFPSPRGHERALAKSSSNPFLIRSWLTLPTP